MNFVDPTGLEPATSSVQVRRSSQMSYGPAITNNHYLQQIMIVTCSGNSTLFPPNRKSYDMVQKLR